MPRIPVYNPLFADFVVTYDINGDGKPLEFVAKGQGITYFTNETVAEHVKKHLTTAILNKRGVKTSWRVDRDKVLKEISLEDMNNE